MNKNKICCEKGLPYKYCCIEQEFRKRFLVVSIDDEKKLGAKIDMTNDILNASSSLQLPLKYFCKDNDFYFFGLTTGNESETLLEKLKSKTLTKQDVFDIYKGRLNEEAMTKFFQSAIDEYSIFKKRESQILKIIKAHYNGDFELTIPTLFAVIEGVLREVGSLKHKDNFKSTIPVKVWEESGLYFIEDDAQNFNALIHKLFEGGKDENIFNRNPIMHGFNVSYFSEEYSLLLILILYEIKMFDFWGKYLGVFPMQAKETIKKITSKRSIKIGDSFSFDALTEYNVEIIKI